VLKSVEVRSGDRHARLSPADQLEIAFRLDYPHPLLRDQHIEFTLYPGSFEAEIASARTFGFLEEVEAMRAAGLARGGSLQNAIVFDAEGVVNEGGLSTPDEALRHKVLDAIGDLALLGMPLLARLDADRPGHALHHQLMTALLAEPTAWTIETTRPNATRSASGK
jgi:UDP-3-O-[3-hydroxymyristoyl] N-acetylglucosamine deacetylase